MKTTFKILALASLLCGSLALAQDSDWETYDSSSESQGQTPSYPDESTTTDSGSTEGQDSDAGSASEDYDL